MITPAKLPHMSTGEIAQQTETVYNTLFVVFEYRKTTLRLLFLDTRPRRPGFKGHPIYFMIILEPYLGPLFGTHMDPFGPIKT